jgi:hypothetical protein
MSKYLGMSDEDFLNELPPEVVAEEVIEPVVVPEAVVASTVVVEEAAPIVPVVSETVTPALVDDASVLEGVPPVDPVEPLVPAAGDPPVVTDPVIKAEEEAPNYETMFKQVMAPFKANGKMVELKSPEEAIQLMQMGVNYTRNMQALQPQRKLMLMLEKNGLMDEGKLSYLIDLDKKDPAAIRKLVKDAGIDPLDIDTGADPAYMAGNHAVSDEESTFRSVLDTMSSSAAGKETLQVINSTWDQASKELLWKDPAAMETIHQQRESGVYDLIATEVDRQRILGAIPAGTSFMQAYQQVGNHMVKTGGFDAILTPAPIVPVTPVITRVASAKPDVENGDKASAAAPSRNAPRPITTAINSLAMSDADFMKMPPPAS